MRRNILWIVLLLTIAVSSNCWDRLLRTSAEEGAAPPAMPPTRVALVDLARIFENHAKFTRQNEALRLEVEQAERQLKARKDELQATTESLKALPKESGQAKKLEEQIALDTAQMNVDVGKQKKHFYEVEAAIYYECYREIMAEVERYAKPRGINLVMRFQGKPYDTSDPQGLQKELNKAVLYQEGIDITEEILRSVN
jgi:Skp family chaperone for outer membrane proteins